MDKRWVETILKKHERDNQVEQILSFEVKDAVAKGSNYASIIYRLNLELLLKSGKRIKKSVILKEKNVDPGADNLNALNPFKTECKIYQNLIYHMNYLMDEFEDDREKVWCQMYGFEPYTSIIFEDLTPQGFRVADRLKSLDMSHAKLTLKSLGRFHAMSRILMDRGLFTEGDLQPFYLFRETNIFVRLFRRGLNQLSSVMSTAWPSEWNKVAERVGNLSQSVNEKFHEIGRLEKASESTLVVCNHGDFWICNVMFKYDANNIFPTSTKFIDFQLSHTSSYIWDVIYFIYCCIQPGLRRRCLNEFYKTYWESLDSNLRRFGYAGEIPTYNDLLEEAERKDLYAFVCMALYHPGMTSEQAGFDLENEKMTDEALGAKQFINECGEDFKFFMNKGVF